MIVSIHDQSWGRTAIGLSIAASLQSAGAGVSLIIHETNAPLLDGKGFEFRVVGNALGPLVKILLQESIAEMAPDALVLCDYFSTCNLLHRLGIEDTDFLFDRPVFALDLWDSARTGFEIDRGLDGPMPICLIHSDNCRRLFSEECRKVTPVPIAPLNGETPRLRLVADERRPERPQPSRARNEGLATVLTTTADWQQNVTRATTRTLATAVPRLLARYLAALGPQVRWVHVGPKAFDVRDELHGRYEWRGRVSSAELDALFASCDLVLSANASAATTLRAVLEGIPVVLAQNSFAIAAGQAPEDAGLTPSPAVRGWIERIGPVAPFRLWPLGYHQFLAPLVENNPYFGAITPAEILREDAFIDTCDRLLFDDDARAANAAGQRAYVDALAKVPGPAEVFV